MNEQQFISELKKININLTKEQLKLFEFYAKFLIEYNTHTNLTAIKDKENIYLKHFYDSLKLNNYLKNNTLVLDIGTGAGFPGVPLAIINSNIKFTLLDSNNKKIKFLEELTKKLNLKNIELINERAEIYVKKNLEKFDIVTSRAVADLRILLEFSLPALKINGLFIPLKSNIEEEFKNSKETINILKGKLIDKEEYFLPIENSKRTILIIEHVDKTNPIYPRTYDKIIKRKLK